MLMVSSLHIIADSYSFFSGAHIPEMSSEAGFLDIVYLGIFVTLSPAFDRRFYTKPSPSLVDEQAYAASLFQSLLHLFAVRFVIFLKGTPVAVSYVVDRILAEFAAAAVVFGRGVGRRLGEGNEIGGFTISFPRFLKKIEGIVEASSPDIAAFFSARAVAHKHFLWSGPSLEIVPRTEELLVTIHLTGTGEQLDWPGCPIYQEDLDDSSLTPPPAIEKRDRSEDGMGTADEQPRKRTQ
jgi:hypothetical protein